MTAKALMTELRLEAALKAVTEHPGSTASYVGQFIPVPPPAPEKGRIGLFFPQVPLTLVLSLLKELEKQGKVYAVADPKGQRWYPAEEAPGG